MQSVKMWKQSITYYDTYTDFMSNIRKIELHVPENFQQTDIAGVISDQTTIRKISAEIFTIGW